LISFTEIAEEFLIGFFEHEPKLLCGISAFFRQVDENGPPIARVMFSFQKARGLEAVEYTCEGGAIQHDPFTELTGGDLVAAKQEIQYHGLNGGNLKRGYLAGPEPSATLACFGQLKKNTVFWFHKIPRRLITCIQVIERYGISVKEKIPAPRLLNVAVQNKIQGTFFPKTNILRIQANAISKAS